MRPVQLELQLELRPVISYHCQRGATGVFSIAVEICASVRFLSQVQMHGTLWDWLGMSNVGQVYTKLSKNTGVGPAQANLKPLAVTAFAVAVANLKLAQLL